MNDMYHPFVRGLDDTFYMPHSRWTTVDMEDIENNERLQVLAWSEMAGASLVASKNGRRFFVFGHPEYDRYTLQKEYTRDLSRGLNPKVPYNYFPHNDPENLPMFNWRSSASILYSNWLNYYVYQQTPYDLQQVPSMSNDQQ